MSSRMRRYKRNRPRAIETGGPSHTEKLTEWISKVHRKKQECCSSPKRDFRVQAVLTYALHKAEYELRIKQSNRMARWQRMKKDLVKDSGRDSCALYHVTEAERQGQLCARKDDTLQSEVCKELNLDDFFQQLGEIKSFVTR